MPDPVVPYPLKITAGSNSTAGTVTIEDITKFDASNPEKNKLRVDLDSNKRADADLANLNSGYSNNDVIEVTLSGIRSGKAVHTVDTSKGKGTIVLTESVADFAGASISL